MIIEILKSFEKWKIEREVDEYNESYSFRKGYVKGMCDAINLVKKAEKNKWLKGAAELKTKPKANCTNCYYFNRPSNICKDCNAINGNFNKWEKNEPKPANNCGYPITDKLEF